MVSPLRGMHTVLFDLDGTLLDTYELLVRSFHHAVVDVLGHDESMEAYNRTIGKPLVDQFALYASSEAQRDALVESYRVYYASIQHEALHEFPGMQRALEDLRQAGFALGVVTSKRHDVAIENLAQLGYENLFDCFVGCDDVAAPKPDPEPVRLGARLMGAQPAACFYVGDSPFDMQAGNAAGAATVAVGWGQHPIDSLLAEGPRLVCAQPADLPAAIARFAQGEGAACSR